MKASEAFLIRKIEHGEADYILILLTKDFGKIRGLAKNAKKSRKRFGGRLEPFVHLRVRFHERPGKMKFIDDSETVEVFLSLMEDIGLFTWGSFILENIDALIPEEEPNEKMFEILVQALSDLNSKKSPLSVVIKFQLSALSLSGYKPDFDVCICARCGDSIEGDAFFSIQKGGILCNGCRKNEPNGFRVPKGLLIQRDLIDFSNRDLETSFDYIKFLIKFTEYHTGKEIRSYKFLEEIKND
ncbi:MAG: DNA repair protein RecO [Candidatus Dadabacteria bacterium]